MRAYDNDSDLLLSFNLTYSSGLDFPRDSAIDHIVKLALSRSRTRALNESEIVKILSETKGLPPLRHNIVSQSLNRLVKNGFVTPLREAKKARFMLVEEERNDIVRLAEERKNRLEKCGAALADRVAKAYPRITETQSGTVIHFFSDVIFQLFEFFGYRSASLVCESAEREPLMSSADAHRILQKTAKGLGLFEEELYTALESEFISMLTGPLDPNTYALFFELSQNFYILKLLGIDPQTSCLSKEVYKGYILYLDSNIIINAILKIKKEYSYFEELVTLVKNLGIQLKITGVTVDEIKRVVEYNKSVCYAMGEDPEEIAEEHRRHDSDFYLAFTENKLSYPSFTLADLFYPFDVLEKTVVEDLGIELETTDEHSNILKQKGRLTGIGEVVYNVAYELKNKKKGDASRHHDAFIYLLVKETRRKKGKKVLHLTLDKTLPFVADRLQRGSKAQPYCFTLDVWLQTLSPFISQKVEPDFARIFVQSFTSDLFVFGEIFRFDDLVLFKKIGVDLKEYPQPVRRKLVKFIESEFERGQIFDTDKQNEARYRIDAYLARLAEEDEEIRKQDESVALSKAQLRKLWRKEAEERRAERSQFDTTVSDLKGELRVLRRLNRLKQIDELKKKKKTGLVLRLVFGVLLFMAAGFILTYPWLLSQQISTPGWRQIIIPIAAVFAGVLLISSKKLKRIVKKRSLKKVGKVLFILLEVVAGLASIVDIVIRLTATQ